MIVSRILRGEAQVDFTPDENYDLVTKTYVDSLALGSTTVSATLTDDGIAELSTGLEAASSTATGGSGSPLMLHTGISTSTGGTAYTIPVTGSTGKIDSGFFSTTSVTQYAVSYASTTVFTSSGTYTKGTGVKFVEVQVQGAGGNGGTGGDATAGGGGGGYAKSQFLASQLSATTSVVVGTAGLGTGSSTFMTMIANNGANAADQTGANGGTATGGNVMNVSGSNGQSNTGGNGGTGGSSVLGVGAAGGTEGSATNAGNGAQAFGYGAGGGGAGSASDNDPDGAESAGTAGIVIITEYF
jgi:hypothetical protein